MVSRADGTRELNEIAIRTAALTRVFNSGSGSVVALDGLTLEVARGRIFGFLGPNGAGKTTMVRLLLGLLTPTAGSAQVLGYDAAHDGARIRERAGALLEHDGLYERLTAYDNLEFYARVWRLDRTQRKQRIRELLERFGLWDRRKDAAGTWSRGMKRKLALARALLHKPQLIFLDEPTAGLDPGAAAALRDDLSALVTHERATIFLNTHNLAEAERLCDQIGVIARGRLLAQGAPHELRRQFQGNRIEIAGRAFNHEWEREMGSLPTVEEVEIRDGRVSLQLTAGAPAAPIVRWLVEHGAEIEEIRRTDASLEDVYLQVTSDPVIHQTTDR
ncbi:MAG: ABC transporter ATP-binding protein [Gemmatimonadota bacterium]